MKKSHSSLILFFMSFLSLAVMVIFGVLWHFMQKSSIYTADLSLQITEITKKEQEFSLLEKTIATTNADRLVLSSHFVNAEHVIGFLETLEQYGRNVGTTFDIVSVDENKDGKSLKIVLKAGGTFVNIYRLLGLLENAPYEIIFDSVSIKNSGTVLEGNGASTWSMNAEIRLVSFSK